MSAHACHEYCDIEGVHEFVRWGNHDKGEAWAPTKDELIATIYAEVGRLTAMAVAVMQQPSWGDPELYDNDY